MGTVECRSDPWPVRPGIRRIGTPPITLDIGDGVRVTSRWAQAARAQPPERVGHRPQVGRRDRRHVRRSIRQPETKLAPCPGTEATLTVPPCASAIWRTRASPRPRPSPSAAEPHRARRGGRRAAARRSRSRVRRRGPPTTDSHPPDRRGSGPASRPERSGGHSRRGSPGPASSALRSPSARSPSGALASGAGPAGPWPWLRVPGRPR